MFAISPDAAEAIRAMVSSEGVPDSAGLRISASPLSSNGRGPQLMFELAAHPDEEDEVIDAEGAQVFLGPAAATMVDGKLLDVWIAPEGDPKFGLREP